MIRQPLRALAALALFAPGAAAQDAAAPTAATAQVLVLGTYHFDNPGLDVVKSDVADVLTPERQAEIGRIVEALARFRPTQIALERRVSRAAEVDSLYAAHRAGRHTLARSEVEQLGFRLAARLDLPRVHAIDHGGEFPFGAVMQYAQQHDTAAARWIMETTAALAAERTRRQRELTIAEILRLDNDPALIREGHALYLALGRVGAGDTYVGADLIARWYERNIRIFSDIQRLAAPGERVLVIFGDGHAAILRELIAGAPGLDLVEATPYLPER